MSHLPASSAAAPALRRRLGRVDLIAMGVGAIVGAGIFVTTGVAAATKAGPAIMLSFVWQASSACWSRSATASWRR